MGSGGGGGGNVEVPQYIGYRHSRMLGPSTLWDSEYWTHNALLSLLGIIDTPPGDSMVTEIPDYQYMYITPTQAKLNTWWEAAGSNSVSEGWRNIALTEALYTVGEYDDLLPSNPILPTQTLSSGALNSMEVFFANLLSGSVTLHNIANSIVENAASRGIGDVSPISGLGRTEAELTATDAVNAMPARTQSLLMMGYHEDAVESMIASLFPTADLTSKTLVAANLNNIVTTVNSWVSAAITSAINSALSAIDQSVVGDAVDAYELAIENPHLRDVGRLAGQFSEINAVNGSAFTIAIAMLERDKTKDINKFRADLSMSIYKDVLPLFMNSFNSAFATYADTFVKELSTYLNMVVAVLGEHTKTAMGMMEEYIQSYISSLQHTFGAWKSSYDSYANISAAMSQEAKDISSLIQQGWMSHETTKYKTDAQMITTVFADSLGKVYDGLFRYIAQFGDITKVQSEVSRTGFVAKKEVFDQEYKFLKDETLWELELWQYMSNYIGAYSGAAVVPTKPNPAASALGGALSGLGAGLATGNPLLGLAGGVIGGIGGFLQ